MGFLDSTTKTIDVFITIQSKLVEPSVLVLLQTLRPYMIYTDASSKALELSSFNIKTIVI